jgi:hypothetical protein
LFGFLFDVFLCWRFGFVGLAFTLTYEFSKFYVFGDRFLGEGFVIYPLVYLAGLSLHTIQKKHIDTWEIILSAVCVWFVVFTREPYILEALFLYGIIIRPTLLKRVGQISLGIVAVLSASLFLLFPFRDFVYNDITLNMSRGVSSELKAGSFFGIGIVKSFFYPLYIFVAGTWNDFRIQLICISVLLIISVFLWIRTKKSLWVLGCLFIAFGLANLRPTLPGLQFYEAYHELNWYGLFVFATFYLLFEGLKAVQKQFVYFFIIGGLFAFIVFSPRSFIYNKVNEQAEFLTNYGMYLQVSEVIKAISTPQETLFTNGADEFLYVVSGRNSSYPYSFDPYSIPFKDKYYDAFLAMFSHTPPDIIYDFCSPDAYTHPHLPQAYLSLYAQWYSQGKPTCLYMKKSLVPGLTSSQRAKAAEFLYYLPEK